MGSASVHRLVTRPQRLARDTSALISELVEALPPGAMPSIQRELFLRELRRITAPSTDTALWPGGFSMISQAQTKIVWDAIEKLPASSYPRTVDRVFKLILLNVAWHTGEVSLTRDQLADEVGCSPDRISAAMSVLFRMNVVSRELRKISGMRGPGLAVYFLNPHIGWTGDLDDRKLAAEGIEPPLLTLMQGGR